MIAIDRPGFGYSNFGASENLFQQAHCIERFVEKLTMVKTFILSVIHLVDPLL